MTQPQAALKYCGISPCERDIINIRITVIFSFDFFLLSQNYLGTAGIILNTFQQTPSNSELVVRKK